MQPLTTRGWRLTILAFTCFFGFLSLLAGFYHLVTCGRFFNLLLGIWNSFSVVGLGVYFCVRQNLRPGTLFFLLFLTTLGAILMLLVGIAGLIFEFVEGISNGSPDTTVAFLREYFDSRAANGFQFCHSTFQVIEHWSQETKDLIHVLVFSGYINIGFCQLILAIFLSRKIGRIFYCVPAPCHCHVIFGIISLVAGSFHLIYCCRYYYVACGYWASAFFFVAGFYHSRSKYPEKVILLILNALCFVAGTTLATLAVMGFLCWTRENWTEFSSPILARNHSLIYQCIEEKDYFFYYGRLVNGGLYVSCFRNLANFGYWQDLVQPYADYAWTELKVVQIAACGTLTLVGTLDAVLSIFLLCHVWYSADLF